MRTLERINDIDKALDNLLSDIVLCKYWMEYREDYLDGLKDAYLIITGKRPDVFIKNDDTFTVNFRYGKSKEHRYGKIVHHKDTHTIEAVLD